MQRETMLLGSLQWEFQCSLERYLYYLNLVSLISKKKIMNNMDKTLRGPNFIILILFIVELLDYPILADIL